MNQSLIILVLLILALAAVVLIVAKQTKPKLSKQYFQKHWQRIESEKSPLAAITAADSLLDNAMRRMGIKGQTMGERLNNSAAFIRDINATWSAHRLRNKLVHEPQAQASPTEVKKALAQFRKALKDLGAL